MSLSPVQPPPTGSQPCAVTTTSQAATSDPGVRHPSWSPERAPTASLRADRSTAGNNADRLLQPRSTNHS